MTVAEPVAEQITPLIDGGRGVRLRHPVRSTDGFDTIAVTELQLPEGTPPAGGWPVVVHGHGTNGLGPLTTPEHRPRPPEENDYLAGLLARGWAVVAPDYLIVNGIHSYLDGPDEALAMVRGLQAARRHEPLLSRKWLSTGGSQGGHAALWAGYRAPELAPELELAGVVALCPASQLDWIFGLIGPRTPARIAAGCGSPLLMVAAAADVVRPDLRVSDSFTPLGQRVLREIRELEIFEIMELVSGFEVPSLLRHPAGRGGLGRQLRGRVAVPTAIPAPVRILQGWRDTSVPLPLTMGLAVSLRRQGVDVGVRVVDSGHGDIVTRGARARALMAGLLT